MNTSQVTGGAGSAWADLSARHASRREKAFSKADSDGSGGVDPTELQTLLAQAQGATAGTGSTSTQDEALFKKMDSDGNGSLDAGELDVGMRALTSPPPSTMGFAQSRGAGGDDAGGPPPDGGLAGLMDQIAQASDTDGDGSLDQDELGKLGDTLASAFEGALQSMGADAGTSMAVTATSQEGSSDSASADSGGSDTSSSDAASQLAQRLATMIAQQYARFSGADTSPDTSIRMAA